MQCARAASETVCYPTCDRRRQSNEWQADPAEPRVRTPARTCPSRRATRPTARFACRRKHFSPLFSTSSDPVQAALAERTGIRYPAAEPLEAIIQLAQIVQPRGQLQVCSHLRRQTKPFSDGPRTCLDSVQVTFRGYRTAPEPRPIVIILDGHIRDEEPAASDVDPCPVLQDGAGFIVCDPGPDLILVRRAGSLCPCMARFSR